MAPGSTASEICTWQWASRVAAQSKGCGYIKAVRQPSAEPSRWTYCPKWMGSNLHAVHAADPVAEHAVRED